MSDWGMDESGMAGPLGMQSSGRPDERDGFPISGNSRKVGSLHRGHRHFSRKAGNVPQDDCNCTVKFFTKSLGKLTVNGWMGT
jgi:hypothetical protein